VWKRPKACDPHQTPNQPHSRGNNIVSMDSEKPAAVSAAQLLPRFVRFRDAPFYLGMDRNRFNTEVRPYLTKIPIGRQGLAFDRLELDAWVEEYISRNGRSGRLQGERLWDAEGSPVSTGERAFGTSTNRSKGNEFAKALDRLSL
jgi:hypothetical protein